MQELTDEVSSALSSIGAISAAEGIPAYVVGGFVRDLLLGRATSDIDIVVEGDASAFADQVGSAFGVPVLAHDRFRTASLSLPSGVNVDIATARTESYDEPAALPDVSASTLDDDLGRRDFTINAMALTLAVDGVGAEGSEELIDPYFGLADLRAGIVRILHDESFVDDPTRILRAARFGARLGFSMDVATMIMARNASDDGLLGRLSAARLRAELLAILAEEEPAAVFSRLFALGAFEAVVPVGATVDAVEVAVERADHALGDLAGSWGSMPAPQREVTLLAAIGSSTVPQDGPSTIRGWADRLDLSTLQSLPALELAENAAHALGVLESSEPIVDSALFRLLAPLSPETIVNLWARSGESGRARIGHFLVDLAGVVAAVDGSDLIGLGAESSPGFSAILARALDDRLDGRAVGREAELANLTRLAQSAGLIAPRKDSE